MSRHAWVVLDLGFGDAGKGGVTDFLARDQRADLVVRFNGGAQAGHNVVTPDGRHHTFSQFGAGTFAGVPTALGPAFLLHPLAMAVEAEHLVRAGVRDPFASVTVDPDARLIDPYQQAAGRLRERLRGDAAHGTCGVGIGECAADALARPEETVRARHLGDAAAVRRALGRQRERKRAELLALGAEDLALFDDDGLIDRVVEAWGEVAGVLRVAETASRVRQAERVVFEGAQGVLLDETWGFHPHTTWSDCTPAGALALLDDRPRTVLGLTRAYAVRHGAGPFPTAGTLAVPEPHNADGGWQGAFRTGALDGVLLRYAVRVCGGVDALAVTCVDRVPERVLTCATYMEGTSLEPGPAGDLGHREALGAWLRGVTPVLEERSPIAFAEEACGVAATLVSAGPSAAHKRWR